MDLPHTIQAIGMWGLLISTIVMAIFGYTYLYHPKCKKNKVLYYEMRMLWSISIVILIFFTYLSKVSLFYTSDIPLNIKIFITFLELSTIGFGIWWNTQEYQNYKRFKNKKNKKST